MVRPCWSTQYKTPKKRQTYTDTVVGACVVGALSLSVFCIQPQIT